MSKRNLIIPIESTSRELLSKVFLAFKFALTGNNTYIGSKDNIYKIGKYLDSLIYLDKGYHRGVSEKIYSDLKTAMIISVDEENGVDYEDFSTLNERFPDKIFNIFNLIFLWGKIQYEFLEANRKSFNKKKVFCSGHPRFELLQSKYSFLYEDRVSFLQKKYKKFILINTSFGLGNNLLSEDVIFKKYNSRIPKLQETIEYHNLQVQNFIELAIRLSSLSDFNIVLRPHPEENSKVYENAFKEYNNIITLHEGSVIPWIIASEVMIHHDCTTSLEAGMLGKSSIAYIKDLNSELTPFIPHKISYTYSCINDVVNNVKKSIYKDIKVNNEILENYFTFSNNTTDEIIKNILNQNMFYNIKKQEKSLLFFKLKTNIKYLLKKILRKEDYLFEQKIKGLELSEINIILKKLNKAYSTNVKVEKINKHLFKIFTEEVKN